METNPLISDSSTSSDAQDEPPDQCRTPFLDNLLHEQQASVVSYHMPGHKHRLPTNPALTQYWGGDLLAADLVEIGGAIDYLHAPKGSLLEAQRLAAAAYGADHTFFLINGSTVGNLGALMSAARDGEQVIIPRASHRSVYGGLVLSGAMPLYVEPVYHPQVGFPLAVSVESVRALLALNPGAKAVHVTAPNYYGYVSDIGGLAKVAHEYGAMLLVDEAHGSHFAFHADFPVSAVHLGADMVVQSTHKTSGALTQSSMLHCQMGLLNLPRVAQVLALLQSSSPSSILLASLDSSRMQMAMDGPALLGRALSLAAVARAGIREIDGLWCYGDELLGEYGIHNFDPTKLVIRVSDLNMTGFEAANILRTDYRLDGEFADLQHIICSITIADTGETVEHLLAGLRGLAMHRRDESSQAIPFQLPPAGLPLQAISPREASFAPSRRVNIDHCIGEICAESIIPYPPGVPLIVPGEVITGDMVDYMKYQVRAGMNIVGAEDATLGYVRVVDAGRH